MNKSILSVALVLSVLASGANAERLNLNLNTQGSLARQSDQRLTDTRPVRELREVRREVTRTNASGEASQRSELVTRDAETGVIMRNVSGITANGRSYSGESVVTATENGFVRETSGHDSAGNSRESATEVLIDKEAGTLSKQMTATRTDSEGETRSVSGESLFERTDDGFSGESSVTNARGETRTRSVDASVNKEAGSMTKTVNASGPNGQASTTTTVSRSQPAAAE